MLKFFKNAVNKNKETAENAVEKINAAVITAKVAIENPVAEGYVDSGVKILIAVVLGALLLAGLYALFNNTIMPTVTQRVQGLFNYNG